MREIETFENFCKSRRCNECELYKIAIDEGCSNCERFFMVKYDKQIRADERVKVIDECVKLVAEYDSVIAEWVRQYFEGKSDK